MPKPIEVTTPSDREIRTRRSFDAPRQLVFDCHTKPELVRRWLSGPPGWSMPVCEIELRVGGRYRYELKGPDGMNMGFGGIFREVVVPAHLASNEKYDDDWTGGETLVTSTFDESADGQQSTVTITILYASKDARDRAAATGMADGMEAGYQKLEGVLAGLSAG